MKKHLFLVSVLGALNGWSQISGLNLSNMDTGADPKKDFYGYCNGNWNKTFQLSASDSRYGSFNEIHENNLKKFKVIYADLVNDKTVIPNSNTQKLRDFYKTAMDSVSINKQGYTPIAPQLSQIDKIKTINDLIDLKIAFDKIGVSLLFEGGVTTDFKNAKKHSFIIGQCGFGISDRDYYFDAKFEDIRKAYLSFIETSFSLAGLYPEGAKAAAQQAYDIEKALAEHAINRTMMRDYEKAYNPHTRTTLQALTPGIKWDYYFSQKAIQHPDTVIVGQPGFMKGLNTLLAKFPVSAWKNYAKWQLLQTASPYLSQDFVDNAFAFRGKALSGAKQMKPRWERVHNMCDVYLGHAFSELYVKKHFTPESKAKIDGLITNLIGAYRDRIASRQWMSAATKEQANRKLDLLIRKIGYPDKWDDYSSMQISTNSYWANVCAASTYLHKKNIEKLKKATDRYEWQMTPATVNAYYDPTTNEITFPAAILQPPFFNPEADDAFNYGIMGSIIGHELTHGFDDGGAQFDADGNLKMWWTEEDYKNFKTKTERIVQQFNNYIVIDTLHINGEMTQGENIADLGGLTMAYYAYKKSLNGKPSPKLDGFTGEQRFFIAWAQGWKHKATDKETKHLLMVDYHSPGKFRAFAPLTNMPEFYEAFNVKEGDTMFTPETKRVEIW
ncbi:MAG: M13 family metallopeptidase [Sediminibacterium sp.]|nr:M13 family metallopeptidase [Sediminibacterium sp.]